MQVIPFVLFLIFSVLFLDRLPGFHFDEAWALNHSLRIAFEEGFWPLRAMTVQTSSWSHYVTAFFFRVFEPSVLVFRLSHVLLNFCALLLFYLGLKKIANQKTAQAFVWTAAFFPALLLNQRFAIEITSFHSACFALLFWSLCHYSQTKKMRHWFLIFVAAFLGFTSHVYFLGVLLALVLYLVFEKPQIFEDRKCRSLLSVLLISVLPFVLSISQEIVWKWKGRALLVLVMLALLWLWAFSAKLPLFVKKARFIFYLLALPFAFNFLTFVDGHWLILHHLGYIDFVWPVGMLLVILGMLSWFYWKSEERKNPVVIMLFKFLIIALGTCGLIMITQAPRYYEIHFWIFAMLISFIVSWAWNGQKFGKRMCLLLGFFGTSVIALNYLKPGFHLAGVHKEFRLGVLKESSYDYIPKTGAVEFLNQESCWNQLEVQDVRLRFVFEILEKVEHPEKKDCFVTKICLERGSPSSSVPYEKILYQDNNLWLWSCAEPVNSQL